MHIYIQKKKKRHKTDIFFFLEKSSKLVRKKGTHSTTEGMLWSIYLPSLFVRSLGTSGGKINAARYRLIVSSQNSQRKSTFIQANPRLLLSTVLQQGLTGLMDPYRESWSRHIPKRYKQGRCVGRQSASRASILANTAFSGSLPKCFLR